MIPIKNFEDYLINKKGEVYSTLSSKILKPGLINGYLYVRMKRTDGMFKMIAIHRLLCLTYKADSWFEYAEIDHINCVRHDNRLENLEWVTTTENQVRAWKKGLHKEWTAERKSKMGVKASKAKIKLLDSEIRVIQSKLNSKLNLDRVRRNKIILDLIAKYNVSRPTINRIARKAGCYAYKI